jgi:serine phosphatase RsbU (regulator of sigma subunit)
VPRLSTEVRLLLQVEPEPGRVVEWLNRSLCEGGSPGKLVTFLLLILDGERHELSVVRAGHMGPLIRRSDGRIAVIGEDGGGPVLGLLDDSTYEATTTTLDPGDVVVLYTDGITDAGITNAPDPGCHGFGDERLKQALGTAPAGVGPCGEAILAAVRRHAAGRDQFDDMTMICFGRA